jgi:hypothetical protein
MEKTGVGRKIYSRICWFFMVAPLVLGVADFVLWYLTRRAFWEGAGYCIIFVGMVSVGLGLIFLFIDMKVQLAGGMAKGKVLRRGILPVGVLFLNFIAAGGLVGLASFIMSKSIIVIHNRSSSPINEIVVEGVGASMSLDRLLPHETVRLEIRFQGEGGVWFHAKQKQKEIGGELGYVSPPLGQTITLTILEDGKYKVQ